MKLINRKLIIIILIILMLLLTACNSVKNINTQHQDSIVMDIIQSSLNDDLPKAREYFQSDLKVAQLNNRLLKFPHYLKNTEIKDFEKIEIRVFKSNDSKNNYQLIYYKLTNTIDNEYVVMVRLIPYNSTFKVTDIEIAIYDSVYDKGKIIDFKNLKAIQVLLLLVGLSSIGFMIYTIVICVKSKVKRKWLWLILIAVLQSGFSLSIMPNKFFFKFLLFDINISNCRTFNNGGFVLTLLFPIGAVIFLLYRRKKSRNKKIETPIIPLNGDELNKAHDNTHKEEVEISKVD